MKPKPVMALAFLAFHVSLRLLPFDSTLDWMRPGSTEIDRRSGDILETGQGAFQSVKWPGQREARPSLYPSKSPFFRDFESKGKVGFPGRIARSDLTIR